jgi:hypothetical protein
LSREPAPKVTDVKDAFTNAFTPILVTLAGISILLTPELPNALFPILVTVYVVGPWTIVAGITTLVGNKAVSTPLTLAVLFPVSYTYNTPGDPGIIYVKAPTSPVLCRTLGVTGPS